MAETISERDQRDIAASLNGDGEAYARLVRNYQEVVAAQMRRFTRDPAALQELMQEVFVEAFMSLKGFRARAPFLHWLRRVATRVGYRHWKSQARKRYREEPLTEAELRRAAAPADLSPSEAGEVLHRLLATLSSPDRLVLTLFYFEECDSKEIAGRTGWNNTLIKVRLHRARKKLKALLNEAGIGRE
ncbi:MAG TPA: sigma-70 family RNA polymerase sigma factor [Thermodesulfobacteriota bacterium]|nr:sigma-70 family RNA polymerase sigma factor [Thermodesulfobacteriota bacterium]